MKVPARSKITLAASSLLGSLAIYAALAACSSGTSTSSGPGITPAHAESPTSPGAGSAAAACAKWEVMIVDTKNAAQISNTSDIYGKAVAIPAGWEPFGTWGVDVIARRCAS